MCVILEGWVLKLVAVIWTVGVSTNQINNLGQKIQRCAVIISHMHWLSSHEMVAMSSRATLILSTFKLLSLAEISCTIQFKEWERERGEGEEHNWRESNNMQIMYWLRHHMLICFSPGSSFLRCWRSQTWPCNQDSSCQTWDTRTTSWWRRRPRTTSGPGDRFEPGERHWGWRAPDYGGRWH